MIIITVPNTRWQLSASGPQLVGRVALGWWMIHYETNNHQQSEALLFSSAGALDTTGGKVKMMSGIKY